MNGLLYLRNRQRTRPIDRRFLSGVIRSLIRDDLHVADFELGIFLVGTAAMTRLNEQHLRHLGPTDVITFDYSDPSLADWLIGDIFVCVPMALDQGACFGVPWQQELIRYVVHGILHLRGYDDHAPSRRAVMKKEENRLVRILGRRFRLANVSGQGRPKR